ncbi:MAG: hypothetical protein ACR2NB_15465, partial [Solirubrobacteraceae bacterium]
MTVNSGRFRRGGALIGLTGVAAVAVFSSAGAFVGAPGSGGPPNSAAPDLLSATIVRVSTSPSTGPAPQVRYCFDSAAATLPGPTNFFITGYDSAALQRNSSANIDPTDTKCVVATYTDGLDVQQATVGGVFIGAVRDVSSRPNPRGSAPLMTGAGITAAPTPAAGTTEGPDLTGATLDAANRQVTYTFDENIAAANPTDFGFYIDTDNGSDGNTQARNGTGIVSRGNNSVVVQFAAGAAIQSAKQFFVKGGSPTDVPLGGVAHPSTIGSFGGPILASPSLVSAAKQTGNPQIVNLTFSQAVIPAAAFNPANVVAYREDGTTLQAQSIGTSTTSNTLPVTFPLAARDDANSIVRVGIAPGVVNNTANNRTNTYGAAAIGTSAKRPGLTDGPDLLSTTIDDANNRATFVFDEDVQDGVTPDGTKFELLNPDGTSQFGQAAGVTVSSDQRSVSVQFSGSVSGAVGVAND